MMPRCQFAKLFSQRIQSSKRCEKLYRLTRRGRCERNFREMVNVVVNDQPDFTENLEWLDPHKVSYAKRKSLNNRCVSGESKAVTHLHLRTLTSFIFRINRVESNYLLIFFFRFSFSLKCDVVVSFAIRMESVFDLFFVECEQWKMFHI